MQSSEEIARSGHVIPWNKGKLIGPKPPLQTKHVWAIRSKLQMESGRANLAMFNLGIDSKLRGCDLVTRAERTSSALFFRRKRARSAHNFSIAICGPKARAGFLL